MFLDEGLYVQFKDLQWLQKSKLKFVFHAQFSVENTANNIVSYWRIKNLLNSTIFSVKKVDRQKRKFYALKNIEFFIIFIHSYD